MSTTIEIMGGLGNQLFQIFTLLSYSIKSRKPFYFENKPITCGERKKYYWETSLLNKLKGFISLHKDPQQLIYKEPFFHYKTIPLVLEKNASIKLYGYFQSYKYFAEHKELIFRMIQLKEAQEQIREKVAPYLPTSAFEKVVSLHFRIGDYAHQPQNHPLMPVEYYAKTLDQLLVDTNGNTDLFILYFCEENDMAYVNEKIHSLKQQPKFKELTFIKVPSQLDDWEQMLLMSLCQHHIIANNTFSWWGAYFSSGEGFVYYPSIWFGSAMETKKMDDLFLEERWKKISVV